MPERTMVNEVREHYVMLCVGIGWTDTHAEIEFDAALAEVFDEGVLAVSEAGPNDTPTNPYRVSGA
jgi:hypothetical protein